MKRSLYREEEVQLRLILKQQRLKQRMQQAALAQSLGKSRTFVSKYELGETFLLFSEVVRICRLLSLDIRHVASLIASYSKREDTDRQKASAAGGIHEEKNTLPGSMSSDSGKTG